MAYRIEIISGPHAGELIRLPVSGSFIFGRSRKSDYVFYKDDLMSGSHFMIESNASRLRLVDLRSRNGTYLESKRVSESDIRGDTWLKAGATVFSVTQDRTADAMVSADDPELLYKGADTAEIETGDSSSDVTRLEYPTKEYVDQTANDLIVPRIESYFERGLDDQDPKVRHNAMQAIGWRAPGVLLEYCREIGNQPTSGDWVALMMLCILADDSDFDRIMRICRRNDVGARRFDMLATYGNPRAIPFLIDSMQGPQAMRAADAFWKITGREIPEAHGEKVREIPPGEDDFRTLKAGPDLPVQPDHEFARTLWNQIERFYSTGCRWCRGINVDPRLPPKGHDRLPLQELLYDTWRRKLVGNSKTRPIDLVDFPHRDAEKLPDC